MISEELKLKANKHLLKLKAHEESLNILESKYNYLIHTHKKELHELNESIKAHNNPSNVLDIVCEVNKKNERELSYLREKIISTAKNIEYHKASSKTYNKVIKIINDNSKRS